MDSKTIATITCHGCGDISQFEDDGSAECMPDGCLLGENWYCDDCIRDTNGNLKPDFK